MELVDGDQNENKSDDFSNDLPDSEKLYAKQIHRCAKCRRVYKTVAALTRHERIHINVDRYACELCDRRFHRKDHLQHHLIKKHKQVSVSHDQKY